MFCVLNSVCVRKGKNILFYYLYFLKLKVPVLLVWASRYVRENNLQDATSKHLVKLDPILADVVLGMQHKLYKRKEKNREKKIVLNVGKGRGCYAFLWNHTTLYLF